MTTGEGCPSGPSAVTELGGVWERDVRWWDAAFYAIVALSVLAVVAAGTWGAGLVATVVCATLILLAYAALGRRAARSREQGVALAYLTVLVAGTLVVVAQTSLGTLLLFAAFTQVWMLIDRLWVAVVLCVVLSVGTTFAIAWAQSPGALDANVVLDVAPQMGVALVFSIGLGLWVAQTMRQAERHARLVDALHATQAELARSNHAAGVAAERERVAQEIHDTLAQGFTSIVMLSQAATIDLDRNEPTLARDRVALVESTARENLAEARALVAASAPAPLQNGTLAEALRRLVARFEDESGVVVQASWGEVPPLSSAREVVVLRSAQEALANVRRHAGARVVALSFGVDDTTIVLEVVDDGRGRAPGTPDGYGLRGMRERVIAEGGTVETGPGVDGRGTRVRVHLPVAPPVPVEGPR